MKKQSSILAIMIFSIGILSQSLQGGGLTRAQEDTVFTILGTGSFALCMAAGPSLCVSGGLVIGAGALVGIIGKAIVVAVNEQRAATKQLESFYNEEYKKNTALYGNKANFVKSEFPEKIEDRIDAIINQPYTNEENQKLFEIFSTPNSKIFVLQNIQDFFEFQQGKEFGIFNLLVYEICTQKINELERMNVSDDDKLIDDARDNYRKKLGISASTLKNMSSAQVNQKIDEIKEIMNQLVRDLVNNKKEVDRKADANFRALVSILTHLYYKQSQKQKMFIGEGLKEGWQQKKPEDIEQLKKRIKLTGTQLMERAALMRSLGRNPEAEQYTQKAFEEKQKEYQEAVKQSAQQSLWSRIKSFFGWR